jgi:hypothetical protein
MKRGFIDHSDDYGVFPEEKGLAVRIACIKENEESAMLGFSFQSQ